MTPLEMQKAFLRDVSELDNPPKSEDIFSFLNDAQIAFIHDRFEKESVRDGIFFERNVKVTEELRPLVVSSDDIAAYYLNGVTIEGFEVDYAAFPADLMFHLNYLAKIAILEDNAEIVISGDPPKRTVSGGSVNRLASVRIAQLDDIHRLLQDPFNTTRKENPLSIITSDGINIVTDSTFITESVKLTYLRYPQDILYSSGGGQACELPEFAHDEIVDLAVQLYLNSKPAVQTKQSQN